MTEVTGDISNLSINKEGRFIEVCVDQDVRLKRVNLTFGEPVEKVDTFNRKDVNMARAKLDEAAASEMEAEENVDRLIAITNDESIEKTG